LLSIIDFYITLLLINNKKKRKKCWTKNTYLKIIITVDLMFTTSIWRGELIGWKVKSSYNWANI